MYEMWSEGGSEELSAGNRTEAIAEMDRRFPNWQESTTMGLYFDPDPSDENSTVLTYDPCLEEWVRA